MLSGLETISLSGHPVQPIIFNVTEEGLTELQKYLPTLTTEAKDLLLIIRVHLRKLEESAPFLYAQFNRQWDYKISELDLKAELNKFEKENAEIQ